MAGGVWLLVNCAMRGPCALAALDRHPPTTQGQLQKAYCQREAMLSWFESRSDPFERKLVRPPERLWSFYWHFVWPVWPVFTFVLVFDLLAALSEVALSKFVADLIDLLKGASSPTTFLADN